MNLAPIAQPIRVITSIIKAKCLVPCGSEAFAKAPPTKPSSPGKDPEASPRGALRFCLLLAE